jgi:hypothetical protein
LQKNEEVTDKESISDERDSTTILLCFFPGADPLHSQRRYHALLRKMNLEA